MSTTLATNAVVENRFSPVCTLVIGFDAAMVARSGLERDAGIVVEALWLVTKWAVARPFRRR